MNFWWKRNDYIPINKEFQTHSWRVKKSASSALFDIRENKWIKWRLARTESNLIDYIIHVCQSQFKHRRRAHTHTVINFNIFFSVCVRFRHFFVPSLHPELKKSDTTIKMKTSENNLINNSYRCFEYKCTTTTRVKRRENKRTKLLPNVLKHYIHRIQFLCAVRVSVAWLLVFMLFMPIHSENQPTQRAWWRARARVKNTLGTAN